MLYGSLAKSTLVTRYWTIFCVRMARRVGLDAMALTEHFHARGYWEVAADGGIFAFGDAPFRGAAG